MAVVTPYITKEQKDDIMKRMVLTKAHIGTEKVDSKMSQHVFARTAEGHHIINIEHTVEKLAVAARIIAAIPNPKDVCVVGARDVANRPVLKFAQYAGACPMAGRWTPGTLTNQITKQFMEPRVVIVANPADDAQCIAECSRANICVIAFCDSDSPLKYVDIAIPCNNRTAESLGLMFWLLCREVRYLKNYIPRSAQWDVMPDLFFHRVAVDDKKEDNGAEDDAEEEDAEVAGESTNAHDAAGDMW